MDIDELHQMLVAMAEEEGDTALASFLMRKRKQLTPWLEDFLADLEEEEDEEEEELEEGVIPPEQPLADTFSPEEEREILAWIKAKFFELLDSGEIKANPRSRYGGFRYAF